jgi:hypothetical protein
MDTRLSGDGGGSYRACSEVFPSSSLRLDGGDLVNGVKARVTVHEMPDAELCIEMCPSTLLLSGVLSTSS